MHARQMQMQCSESCKRLRRIFCIFWNFTTLITVTRCMHLVFRRY